MASSALSRRMSEFLGRGAVRVGADVSHLACQLQRVGPGVVLQHRIPAAAGELRRTGRRVHRRAVVPDARLRGLPHPTGAGGGRLALLLVPRGGRGVHEDAGRRAAVRLHLVVPVDRLRDARRRRQGVSRRRLRRRSPGGRAGRVSESHRLDHPDSHAALCRHHPVDAVLVRTAVLRALAGGARALDGLPRRNGAPA